MTRRLRLSSLAAALTAAILCVTVHAQSAPRNLLWKATSKQGSIYLVGSLHLLSADYYPLSPAMDDAFKDSGLLVEEVDFAEMTTPASQLEMLRRGMLPPGQTLDKVISPETLAAVTKKLEATGTPVEPLKQFKPWMLAITLLGLEWQKAGFDPSLGVDMHFYERAKAEGKQVQGLETVAYQVSRFDDMPMPEQDRLLAETLKELETETASVTDLANAWKAGDAATIERIVLEDVKKEPKVYERLLVERNRNWLPKIEALVPRTPRAFIVVGAAHLVGPDGLLQMLKAKGYTVQQL